MKILEFFNKDKAVFSIETFPPKKNGDYENVYKVLESFARLNPNYISVTCGAGGSALNGASETVEIASFIKNKLDIEAVAHLTCVNSSRNEAEETLKALKASNVSNILALRGDINPNIPRKNDFKRASDLITFMREAFGNDFGISGACYPEGHVEAESLEADLKNLKKKVDAGAETLISQLFFDNSNFYAFLEKARNLDINVPISAGIMPVTNKKQIERIVSMCGASLPPKFSKIIARYENNPEALRDAGIAYAVDQIVDLIANGADGIHLYAMNSPYVAEKIYVAIRSLL